jgi:hypothetical protein
MALCSTPCLLGGLSAELLFCSPDPMVSDVGGQGCPRWSVSRDHAGFSQNSTAAAMTNANCEIMTLILIGPSDQLPTWQI